MEERIDVSKVRQKGERLSFAVLLAVSVLILVLAAVTVFGLIWLSLYILLQIFFHQFTMAYFRANSVKLGPNQYPELFHLAGRYTERLGLKKVPDIYVIQATTLNAFVTIVARRHVIVLYSHTVETMLEEDRPDALGMVLAHELGHIAAKHLRWTPLLSSGGILMPMVYWKWSRCCEYTADRLGYLCLDDKNGAIEGLLKLTVGKRLALDTNIEALEEQYTRLRKDGWAKIAEMWSTHPHLLNRIRALKEFSGQNEMNKPEALVARQEMVEEAKV